MANLLEQLKLSRQSKVKLGEHTFTIRRPTDWEAVGLTRSGGFDIKSVVPFVVDWDLTELDIIPGGTDAKAELDVDLLEAWIEDKPHVWGDLIEAVNKAYTDYVAKRNDTEKKL